jgi:ATP-dependent protease ClpP protease subunit
MSIPEIKVFGVIGDPENGITARQFQEKLDALGDVSAFAVRIASDGGSVPDGIAIHNAIKNHPAQSTTIVESALSIASFIAIAGDDREIAPNGMMMTHGARADTYGGTESDHEQRVNMLKTANQSMRMGYMAATGKTEEEITALLAVDTWMDADQALAAGLVTRIGKSKSKQIGAGLARALERFPTMPARLVAMVTTTQEKESSMSATPERKPATVKELKAAFPKAKADFILAQVEKEATMEESQVARIKAMEEEMEAMAARLAAMEEEKEEAATARAMEEEEEAAAKAKAMEEEEEEVTAKAKVATARAKTGTKPVAHANGVGKPVVSARTEWNNVVQSLVAKGMTRQKAVLTASKTHGDIREMMVAEANS